jgi:hypothetical protein
VFSKLKQILPERVTGDIGLDLENLVVDGCIVKAPCSGEAAGPSRVDRGKQGTKRSLLVDAGGIPLGVVVAPANPNDSSLLARGWRTSPGSPSSCLRTPGITVASANSTSAPRNAPASSTPFRLDY